MLDAAGVLSAGGPLAELVDGFRDRVQQQEMAQAIYAALESHESLICEAGTGTGKTFAYLVPALMSGGKIIVSTGTRHLQDQLFDRDLPLIRRALTTPVNITLLKGRANYLCLHRLQQTQTDTGYLGRTAHTHLQAIRQWSHSTRTGDLAELSQLPEEDPVRYVVTSTVDNCLGAECGHYDQCFVFRARKQALDADVVIVNHHLFLADMALRDTGYGELLPSIDTVIFDEAHKLPDLASMFFSRTLSSRQLLELNQDSRTAYMTEAADMPEFLTLLDQLDKSVLDLRLALGREDKRLPWQPLHDDPDVLSALRDLLSKGHDVHNVFGTLASRGKELENCSNRLLAGLNHLDEFSDPVETDYVQWVETRGNGFFFHQTPLVIADLFMPRLSAYGCNAIFTSATLSVNGSFNHFAGQIGAAGITARSWDSPFDFQSQAMCYIPDGMPDPRDAAYTDKVVEMAMPVLALTRGRAFLLFTSYRALRIAAELLRDELDYPVLVQGDAPRTDLLQSFRDQHHSVLLGTSSFWEGVDVRGQALSCVIIDKLPFAAPDDPVLQARLQKMQADGRNPFMEYQVPEAVIILKQGIGRLIRDPQDYGVLMLCDPRIKSRSYGRIFLKSLPQMGMTSNLADVGDFLNRHENKGAGGP